MTDRKEPIGVLSWFVARRYLVPAERKALASVITAISMVGVAVGVAALIVVIGVMDGAKVHLYAKMADLIPHLKIRTYSGEPLVVSPELMKAFQDPRVKDLIEFVEPVLERPVMIQSAKGYETQKKAVTLIGTADLNANPIYKDTIRPKGDAIRLGMHEVLLGSPLIDILQAKAGGRAIAITLGNGKNGASFAAGAMPRPVPLKIKGFYDTGFYAFDSQAAFVSQEQFREIFGVKAGVADSLYVRLKDPFKAEQVRKQLNLPLDYVAQTWAELNSDFFTALAMEKIALFIILLLIILVAAFNIIGTLILMVIEKTRAVGILRAIGASEGLIMRIFLLDGISIGASGTLLGVALGTVIGLAIPAVKIPMPPKVYNFDHLPVEINPWTVLTIVVCSLTISTLAALIPARQAAKLNPVEALRYD
jgi:lipoprotein-releasing system permease protein